MLGQNRRIKWLPPILCTDIMAFSRIDPVHDRRRENGVHTFWKSARFEMNAPVPSPVPALDRVTFEVLKNAFVNLVDQMSEQIATQMAILSCKEAPTLLFTWEHCIVPPRLSSSAFRVTSIRETSFS